MQSFLMDVRDRIHWLRVAGLIYLAALPLSWNSPLQLAARGAFVAGWWMSFCDKRQPRRLSEFWSFRHVSGALMIVLSLVWEAWFLAWR